MSLIDQYRKNVEPGPFYESDTDGLAPASPSVRLIAYYLPQFHPIAENDLWWGKGFTEWTNVSKACPLFSGHYQPHLPGELGFYDLRMPEVLYRQAALARQYGIYGFCIHHYWFNGNNLLGTPLKILLEHRDIDIRFCLNWANENWTRRWDGHDHDILMAQHYSPADDLDFARSLEPALADPRYIRINGRPLLMIYRPNIMPDPEATVERWRTHFQRAGFGDPYIVMPQVFDQKDPRLFGMDAAAGFPPHLPGFLNPAIRRHLKLTNPAFRGTVVSYEALVRGAMENRPTDFPLLPGVCPGWDNSPRRDEGGYVLYNSTPAKYERWLRGACDYALQRPKEEAIVFINAWNEWAEGAHLEPDRHFGYAYLAATARALSACSGQQSARDNRKSSSMASANG